MSRPESRQSTSRGAIAIAFCASLGLFWANFLTTGRWADIEGSINGPKRPYFAAALLLTTLAAAWRLWRRPSDTADEGRLSTGAARLIAGAGVATLTFAFLQWFPPGTWRQVPFLDDWPIRYQAAVDMMRLLDGGTFTGWEWRFLGGYHSSSDATQGLGTLTYLPMKLAGPTLGFHLAHVVLFILVPVLVWRDLSLDPANDRRVSLVAVGTVCLTAAGYSYHLIRSGDTNSLGGVVTVMTAILGAHAARIGRSWGVWLLIPGLTLAAYAHPGFFAYGCLYLALDAALAADRRAFVRAVIAGATGVAASLPLTFESWRYPDLFHFNNVVYTPATSIDWSEVARSLYYNVELLLLPGRWFNDFSGLTLILLPVAIAVAWSDRSRVRYYAAALLLTVGLMRLHNPYSGYVLLRPLHMLPVFVAPVVALLVARYLPGRWLRWSMIAMIALYLQVSWRQVPHVESIRDFNAPLIDQISSAPGALVLLENNPHRNMNALPGGRTEPSRFGTHFEVMVAEETGRRLYSGGYSDGWQWTPWKGQVLAGGTFMGRDLPSIPRDEFVAEMRRWGVASLFVWSDTTLQYLATDPRFTAVWRDDIWTRFTLADVDTREVLTADGSAHLVDRHPHGADVVLTGVTRGSTVVVRTNSHPAWSATAGEESVPLTTVDDQMAFAAPCDGTCRVALRYPDRRGLLPLAAMLLIGVTGLVALVERRHRR